MRFHPISRLSKLALVALCMAAPVAQAQVNPIIFERSPMRVMPAQVKDQPPRDPVDYNVEVRSEEALQLEYIHTLNTLADNTGVVIVFNGPSMVALPRMQVFTPVDALFVAEDGTIVQIYPDVTLGQLEQDVYAKDPVRAFVFLKAGQVAAHKILPHDVIEGSMFTPAPPVME